MHSMWHQAGFRGSEGVCLSSAWRCAGLSWLSVCCFVFQITIQQGHTPRCNLKPCRVIYLLLGVCIAYWYAVNLKMVCFSFQGLVKPDIVFFGEDLPRRFHSLKSRDFSQCDLLLVMGTSLEVGTNQSRLQLYC